MTRHFDDLMLGSLEIYCLAAELGSFAAAAQSAGLSPAAISRSISRLEERLGVQLFLRSTRRMQLTEAGQLYYDECRSALDRLMEAERRVTGNQVIPAGIVRISIPTPLGHRRILPMLTEFRALHPEITLHVHLSNRNIDLFADGFDLAIRGRTPPDSRLIARKLMDAELVVVASPFYLAQRAAPLTLSELHEHDCIQFILPSSGRPVPWLFCSEGEAITVATLGHLVCSGDLLGAVTLAHQGAGLLQTYRFIVENDLASGHLVEVLEAHGGRSRPFSMLYAGSRDLPARVRLLADFLVNRFERARNLSSHGPSD